MHDAALWIALRDLPGLRRAHARDLIEHVGPPPVIFGKPAAELARWCPTEVARSVRLPDLAPARAELAEAHRRGWSVLLQGTSGFPERLHSIQDPPLLVYVLGRLPGGPPLAIVGSRRPSARGLQTARDLAGFVAAEGGVVVSGLAYGVDAAAHAGALDAGGATVAILASGLDRAGPAGNLRLARRILELGGAWLSEYPPGTRPRPHFFPERNRLISGLSSATLVVEARERSGTLWTANHAAEQGRDVLVVPGPVDTDQCRGSNRLLRDGAHAILEGADLVRWLWPGGSPGRARSGDVRADVSGEARRLLDRLRDGPAEPDRLARDLGLEPAALSPLLLELELSGAVVRTGSRVARR